MTQNNSTEQNSSLSQSLNNELEGLKIRIAFAEIDEDELNPMTLYPNPAKESIRILGIEANSTIEIYNSLGERVRTVSASPDQEIGVSDLASGLYLVRCGNRILRFIKQQ